MLLLLLLLLPLLLHLPHRRCPTRAPPHAACVVGGPAREPLLWQPLEESAALRLRRRRQPLEEAALARRKPALRVRPSCCRDAARATAEGLSADAAEGRVCLGVGRVLLQRRTEEEEEEEEEEQQHPLG